MYAVSKRHYTAAGGEVQVVVFTSDGRQNKEIDVRIDEVNAVLH